MDNIQKGWFSEVNSLWPGQSMSIEVDRILYEGQSQYQKVLVFKSKHHGNVLVLDGVIQCTEHDEFSYQEMLAHLPLCSHRNPKKVLIIGGGDGGVLREVCKHKCVEEVTICEIDKMVIEVSKQYLPNMACSFEDPRVTKYIGDGYAFLSSKKKEWDIIIVDSSDPVGPAQTLFEKPFYEHLRDGLKDDGIACTQAECQWLHLSLIKNLIGFSRKVFKNAEYAFASVPTYPSGQIGFLLGSMGDPCREPKRSVGVPLKYYNEAVHRASFALPQFTLDALKEV